MPEQSEPFRRDASFTAKVFDSMFADPVLRKRCIEAMAESMETAHRYSPNAWEITLFPNKVHLNVGPIAVLYYSVDRDVYCVVERRAIPEGVRKRRDVHLNLRPGGALSSVPESAECTFPAESAEEVFPLIRRAHNRLIQAASARQRSSAFRNSYSPGVIEYLSGKAGRQLSRGLPYSLKSVSGPSSAA
jgi:hypothetical protein